ncbi:phosphosulfolactate synthase [Virgibacillus xinjiangensis]|uniref:Phosphosulfolactate synthase n=1 Tax=Virgibacillus xinjiangensis TaxID=393090 RepID=A0ABV7CVH1_9BACI
MRDVDLKLPFREAKPRNAGMTIVIDNGASIQSFKDVVNSFHMYIDMVKFGWGTSLVTDFLDNKIEFLKDNNIGFFFGGTLFEKFLSQDKIDQYYEYCRHYGCTHVEISNGTILLSNKDKARFITDFSRDFTVFSEVGNKDPRTAAAQSSAEWLACIHEDMEAGADKVITEARESGTSGLCGSDGEVRDDVLGGIETSRIPMEKLIFEAPTKKMQSLFINRIGPHVNLANIALSDVISLETLRLGLRSDTFFVMREQEER